MQIGLAEVNITPPLGMQIPGYGSKKRESTGVKDELMAKAMVIESKDKCLALIVLDIISLDRESHLEIRRRVQQFTGIPQENIMVSCTHTHTGPPRKTAESYAAYYSVLTQKAADAAIIAHSRRVEARIGFGRGYEGSVAFNRRFYMKDGSLKTNPGILNPNIDRPEGPIDPEILVMRIDDADGKPIGIVSNYALHTDTVKGTEYSGDFPAYISRTIKNTYGEQVVSLFLQGACGNINHIDVSGGHNDIPIPHPQRIGEILGLEISKTRNKIKAHTKDVDLATSHRMVTVSERQLNDSELEWAQETLDSLSSLSEAQMTSTQVLERDRALNRLRASKEPIPTHTYEIQIAVIGELAIAALPAEIFVEFGMEIKKKSPYRYTMINELSNGSGNGYVCTKEAHERGGYETSGHQFAIEAGDLFVKTALELLQSSKAIVSVN